MFMHKVQATEAKARFAELLRTVERGETVVITRHGQVVARVTPAYEAEREDYSQAVSRFCRRLQALEPIDMTIEEILQARHLGHRW